MDETILSDAARDYERDFVGWTESQASILRRMPAGTFGLDTENLAEEIETLGRSELREASSLLRQMLIHLIKVAVAPNSDAVNHWRDEILTFHGDAVIACTSGIKQRIDLQNIWRLAAGNVRQKLEGRGDVIPNLPALCPMTLDYLLDPDFRLVDAVAVIINALESAAPKRRL